LGATLVNAANWKRTAGLIAAPLVWLAMTQIGQILPYHDCEARTSLLAFVVAGGIAVTFAALTVSVPDKRMSGRSNFFISRLSVGIALIFIFALALQALAAVMLNPCQR
jgi:hypothetical protein